MVNKTNNRIYSSAAAWTRYFPDVMFSKQPKEIKSLWRRATGHGAHGPDDQSIVTIRKAIHSDKDSPSSV